jgi:hypothetical protein
MTETWETYDNIHHINPNDPNMVMKCTNVDMKWIMLPKELGGKKANVLKRSYKLCRCKTHNTMAYTLENDVVCYHCKKMNGFVFAH